MTHHVIRTHKCGAVFQVDSTCSFLNYNDNVTELREKKTKLENSNSVSKTYQLFFSEFLFTCTDSYWSETPYFGWHIDNLSECEQLQAVTPSHATWCISTVEFVSPACFRRPQSSMAWAMHLLEALFVSTGSPCQVTAHSCKEGFGNASPLFLKYFLSCSFHHAAFLLQIFLIFN